MRPALLFSFFEYVFLSGRNRGFLNIYIPLDAPGSNLINYLKLETMGVKMITFSVGVELKNIKKNSENTFFLCFVFFNQGEPRPNNGYAFPEEGKEED